MSPDKRSLAAKGLATRRSLALPMRPRKISLVGRRFAEPQTGILRSLQLPTEFGHWGLVFVWNLSFGIYLRAIIPVPEKRDSSRRRPSDCACWGTIPACLKEMDIRGYFALRLPRGVTVAPEILDLFV